MKNSAVSYPPQRHQTDRTGLRTHQWLGCCG